MTAAPPAFTQARTILDDAEISDDDRASFLENLTSALADPDKAIIPAPENQRQSWARALLVIVNSLLAPVVEVPSEGDEEEEFILTQSEYEIWKSLNLKESADVEKQNVAPEEPLSEDQPSGNQISTDEPAEDEGSDEKPAEPEPVPKAPGQDDFEDFVIDAVVIEP
jgi:hypothetical protein